jgi:zinc transport system substrate-binding protein
MSMFSMLLGAFGAAAVLLGGCGRGEPDAAPAAVAAEAEADGPLTVYAVNYPLAYFAERIGGDDVVVRFPVPGGEDPAFWSPDAATIRAYQSADVILLNGATYARWVEHATLSPSRLVDTAFTTWLDFEQAAQQAVAVRDALVARRSERANGFQTRADALDHDLQDLHRSMLDAVGTGGDRPILVSHPVYQYWVRAYGLNAQSMHWEPGIVPDDPAWLSLATVLEEHPAKWMIWEGPPAAVSTERLSAFDVESAVFAPCGNRPEEGDFLDAMRANVENVRKVFVRSP